MNAVRALDHCSSPQLGPTAISWTRQSGSSHKQILKDGSELSFVESVERIPVRHSSHAKDLVHEHLGGWLEQGELLEGLSEDKLERLDSFVSQ